MYAKAPIRGRFKLRHKDHHHCHHNHHAYQIHVWKRPRRRLCFQVTVLRPSPSSPGLSNSCMRTPTSEAPFSSYGTKAITTVPSPRPIKIHDANTPPEVRFKLMVPRPSPLLLGLSNSCMRTPTPEVPFTNYHAKTITTVTRPTYVRIMVSNTPAGGSIFKLYSAKPSLPVCHQAYQIHVRNTPAGGSVFK